MGDVRWAVLKAVPTYGRYLFMDVTMGDAPDTTWRGWVGMADNFVPQEIPHFPYKMS